MNRKEAELKHITIYWWNFGNKTLDFSGTYHDWFKKKNVKITSIKFPRDKKIKGLKLKSDLNTNVFTLESYDNDILNVFNHFIETYLQALGDKTKFIDGYGREHQINWR